MHSSGEEQPELSQQARAAIFERKERAFRCTLPSQGRDGCVRWTLFEMFANIVRFLSRPLYLKTSCGAFDDDVPRLEEAFMSILHITIAFLTALDSREEGVKAF